MLGVVVLPKYEELGAKNQSKPSIGVGAVALESQSAQVISSI
jgi:NADPH-dependent 7-cyano-7-deazaguanine reductase QueF-like protein